MAVQMFYRFSFFSIFILCGPIFLLISCGEEPTRVFIEPDCPEVEPEIVEVPVLIEPEEPEGFRPDFTVITMYTDIHEFFRGLRQHRIIISNWTNAAMSSPLFTFSRVRRTYHIVVVSMLQDMGFTEPATYDEILEWASGAGLYPMSFEVALMLREQFLAQPDRSTGHRLGGFFVAINPPIAFPTVGEGIPKIPSIVRDDEYPHEAEGFDVKLLIMLNELQFIDGNTRVFDPDDGVDDLEGRFAFVVPDHLNLDLIEALERQQEEQQKQDE